MVRNSTKSSERTEQTERQKADLAERVTAGLKGNVPKAADRTEAEAGQDRNADRHTAENRNSTV